MKYLHTVVPLSLIFWIIVILTGVKWYPIMVLICVFLMISGAEHLFVDLLVICISLEKCLFRSFCPRRTILLLFGI